MKLDCDIIKDLYVLYQEDELSPKVKGYVDDHLKGCSNCKELYEYGDDFSSLINGDSEVKKTPSKLDDKIKLKIRLRRWKATALIIAVIFLVYSYFEYVDDRRNLLYAISSTEQNVNDLFFSIRGSKNNVPGDIISQLDNLNQKNNTLVRHLNYFEDKSLDNHEAGLFIDFKLSGFLKTLNKRNSLGVWSDRDEKALNMMKEYFKEYSKNLTNKRLNLNDIYKPLNVSSLISPVDVTTIADLHNSINELSYTYTRFGKFPNEIDILSKNEVKAKLVKVFDIKRDDIEFLDYANTRIKSTGEYRFDIKNEKMSLVGQIDAYTGEIIRFQSHYKDSLEGKLLPKSKALDILNKYLISVYGDDSSFKINSLGINHNFSSNRDIKLYTYEFSPINNKHILNGLYRIYIDGRTGDIFSLRHLTGELLENDFFNSLDKINYSPEKAINNLKSSSKEIRDYTYSGTIFIKSLRNWKYSLVHVYRNDENNERIFINALNGKREIYMERIDVIK